MSVCSQALTVNPRLGNGIGSLLLGETQQLRDDSCRGNLDKYNMVQTDLVVRVEKSQAALNLVCLDHGLQDLFDSYNLSIAQVSSSSVCARNPVCNCQNSTQVVRRVAPFCGEPAVIVVEPSDHSTDVECAIDGIELEGCAGNLGTVWNDSPLNNWTKKLCAFLKSQTLETAA